MSCTVIKPIITEKDTAQAMTVLLLAIAGMEMRLGDYNATDTLVGMNYIYVVAWRPRTSV